MPRIPITMPQLGESIAEATIVRLPFNVGDEVESDQEIIEVETNKATMGVTTPCRGTIAEITVVLQQTYSVGTVLGYIEVSEESAARFGSPDSTKDTNPQKLSAGPSPTSHVSPVVHGLPVPAHAAGISYMSPRMKARMAELGLHSADLAGIAGSGAGGRVTVEDLEDFLYRLDEHKQSPASSMRVAVADAMRRSWTRPLATVGRPVRLDAVLAHRKASDPKPGPALYALRALAIALGENSAPAGRLVGEKIVHPRAIDVGFAVEAEDGVLVPVLRNADKVSLSDLLSRYDDLVELARLRRLPVSAQGGSIATVTNFGTFGLTWATPIPLPEQTLVLGLGAGSVAPSWDRAKNQFVPVTEADLTLSFDHRVLDGGAAGRLLARIVELLQSPERL
jgi:pyruvate/2-oxoglutarate dehydrogenase complex dihydrolipoamide acyltransferase (E2) component